MKKRILIIIMLGIIFTTIIYFNTKKDQYNFLSLGDSISLGQTYYKVLTYNYNDYLKDYFKQENNLKNYYNFNEINETTTSLLNKINNNININKITIKQAIKEVNIITINIGMDELNNYTKTNYLSSTKINNYLTKYEEIIKIITKLNHNKIYLISLYPTLSINKDKIIKINNELQKLSNKYNLIYIDISNISNYNEFFDIKKSYYLNYKGQEFIYNKIINNITLNTINII